MEVQVITPQHVDGVVETLHEAFLNYPVMRFVLGNDAPDFRNQHIRLVRLFVMGRVLSADPMFGIGDPACPEAVATVTLPQSRPTEALQAYREVAWAELGDQARGRYYQLCDAWEKLDVDEPQLHLNMIGTRNAHRGKGHGRRLIEHVIGLSDADPGSNGVSLTTEIETNVSLYEHLGFEVTGHIEVAPGMETWNFFRWNSD